MKEQIILKVSEMLSQSVQEAKTAIANAQASANEATKSSAGDKYETSRAMGQLDIEMYTRQLHDAESKFAILQNIEANLREQSEANLGALVDTTLGSFFLAVGIGKIDIDKKPIMVISPQSPIGEVIFQKKSGDSVLFRGKEVTI
ncbi:MAG: GreA/GreB family elongation factor, partial [Spirosomaceae bacterium]|nr:GreA/GreB family elongation factor [Spirosomataceae bacterium]